MSTTTMFHTTKKGTIEQSIDTHTPSGELYGVVSLKEQNTSLDIFLTKETVDALLDNVKCLNRRLNQ